MIGLLGETLDEYFYGVIFGGLFLSYCFFFVFLIPTFAKKYETEQGFSLNYLEVSALTDVGDDRHEDVAAFLFIPLLPFIFSMLVGLSVQETFGVENFAVCVHFFGNFLTIIIVYLVSITQREWVERKANEIMLIAPEDYQFLGRFVKFEKIKTVVILIDLYEKASSRFLKQKEKVEKLKNLLSNMDIQEDSKEIEMLTKKLVKAEKKLSKSEKAFKFYRRKLKSSFTNKMPEELADIFMRNKKCACRTCAKLG